MIITPCLTRTYGHPAQSNECVSSLLGHPSYSRAGLPEPYGKLVLMKVGCATVWPERVFIVSIHGNGLATPRCTVCSTLRGMHLRLASRRVPQEMLPYGGNRGEYRSSYIYGSGPTEGKGDTFLTTPKAIFDLQRVRSRSILCTLACSSMAFPLVA